MEEKAMKRVLIIYICLLCLFSTAWTQPIDPADKEQDAVKKIELMERKIQWLLEEGDQLDRKGKHREARILRDSAEALSDELEALMIEQAERVLEKARLRMELLLEKAEKAKAAGEEALAEALFAEVEEIESRIKQAREERNIEETIRAREQEIRALYQAAELAEREEDLGRAEELHKKAKILEAELEEFFRGLEKEKLERVKMRVQVMRQAAEEARLAGEEKRAHEALAEAEALERELARELEEQELKLKMEQVELRLHELREAAVLFEEEGKLDEAARLLAKARNLEEDLKGARRERADQKLFWIREDLQAVREKAKAAEQRGDREEAEHLWAVAEDLDRALVHEESRMALQHKVDDVHHEIVLLLEEAEAAERKGEDDRAEALRRRAGAMEGEVETMIIAAEREDRLRELEHVRRDAEEAEAEGRHEEARELLHMAQDLELSLQQMEKEKARARDDMLAREVAELRGEVRRLRREIDRLNRKGISNPAYKKAYENLQMLLEEYKSKSSRYTKDHPYLAELKKKLENQEKLVKELETIKYLDDSAYSEAVVELLRLREEYGEKSSRYTDKHPELLQLQAKLEAQEKLVEALESKIALEKEELSPLPVSENPLIQALMDQEKAFILTENRYDKEQGLRVFDLRRKQEGPVVARVTVNDKGDVKGIEMMPDGP
jgi:hypothetical protein